MKNLIYKIAIASVFFFSVQNIIAQDRNITWVHGLDGDTSSWQHYEQIFYNERNLNNLRAFYTTDVGITNSANQVITSMNTFYGNNNVNEGANNPQNMGIGHSMGGLMIRDVDRLTDGTPKKFGGYITVATPNYGAPISNSLMDGSVQSAAANACNKLADGPLAQLFSLPWGIVSNLATNTLCNKFIDNDLVQNLQGNADVNADLRVGSPTIDEINYYTDNTNPNIPRISIWAQENSPVHWRMISSAINNNDMTLVNQVNSARGVYNGFYVMNNALGVSSIVTGFLNPFSWGLSSLHFYRASQWRKGRNWIDDSENIWSSLIKTTRQELQTYYVMVYNYCTVTYNPFTIDCSNGSWSWEPRTRLVSVNYPSDGLLPQYTQELQGIPEGNRYQVNGANHIEVRNMSNSPQGDVTKQRFDEIFERLEPDFFRTD